MNETTAAKLFATGKLSVTQMLKIIAETPAECSDEYLTEHGHPLYHDLLTAIERSIEIPEMMMIGRHAGTPYFWEQAFHKLEKGAWEALSPEDMFVVANESGSSEIAAQAIGSNKLSVEQLVKLGKSVVKGDLWARVCWRLKDMLKAGKLTLNELLTLAKSANENLLWALVIQTSTGKEVRIAREDETGKAWAAVINLVPEILTPGELLEGARKADQAATWYNVLDWKVTITQDELVEIGRKHNNERLWTKIGEKAGQTLPSVEALLDFGRKADNEIVWDEIARHILARSDLA